MRTAIISVSVWAFAAIAAAATTPTTAGAAPPPPEVVALAPDHGPSAGGSTVTVTGSGFVAGDTLVSVGGDYVDADVHGPTELAFVMPAHDPGPVTVRIVVSERSSIGTFFLVDGAVPSVTPSPTPSRPDTPRATPVAEVPVAPTPVRRHATPSTPKPDAPSVGRPPELAATGAGTGRLALAGLACLLAGAGLVRACARGRT